MNPKKILFGTDGIRGKANIHPMTSELALSLGKAVAEKGFKITSKPKILVGKDTRLSGYMLETAIVSGIVSRGANALLVGPMPTASISHLVKSMNCSFGLMISASHNPAQDNGIKVFDKNGLKITEQTELELEELVLKNNFSRKTRIGKAFRVEDARGRYIEFLKTSVNNQSFEKTKIVLDCANGSAYSIAPEVFKELGAKVISINVSPNGKNINKNCGAINTKKLVETVKKHSANYGFAFDGDADRCVVCTGKGKILNGDHLLYFLAKKMKQEKKLSKNTIACTVLSNLGLDYSLKKINIKIERTPVGDKHVIERMKKKNLSLGGEQSGHIVFGKHLMAADGIMTALKFLSYAIKTKSIEKELNELKLLPQKTLNVKVKTKTPFSQIKGLSGEIENAEKKLQGNGRILVRYSGTENKARIMIESKNSLLAKKLAEKIATVFKREAQNG